MAQAEVFDPKLLDDGADDNPVRGTEVLSPAEHAAREAEKAQLLRGHVIPHQAGPRARRRNGGESEHDWPDEVAVRTPRPEAEEERAPQPPSRDAVGHSAGSIESLAAVVRQDENRLRESKKALRKALKKIL